MGDLVAHLHHLRHDAFAGKGGNRVARVTEDLIDELLVFELLPCFRRGLLIRIGPTVGVMQIKEKVKSLRFGALGQGISQIVGQLIGAGRGIVKESQAHPVVLMLAQDSQHILGLAVLFEDHPVPLALCQKRNVSADGILLRQRRSSNAQKRTEYRGELETKTHDSFPLIAGQREGSHFPLPGYIPAHRRKIG